MSFDLAKVVKELGDSYKYFKYVPATHREYAQQDLVAFKKLVRNYTQQVRGTFGFLREGELETQVGKAITNAYVRSEKAKAWIAEHSQK